MSDQERYELPWSIKEEGDAETDDSDIHAYAIDVALEDPRGLRAALERHIRAAGADGRIDVRRLANVRLDDDMAYVTPIDAVKKDAARRVLLGPGSLEMLARLALRSPTKKRKRGGTRRRDTRRRGTRRRGTSGRKKTSKRSMSRGRMPGGVAFLSPLEKEYLGFTKISVD